MSHSRFKNLLIGVFFIFLSDSNRGDGSFGLYAYKKLS